MHESWSLSVGKEKPQEMCFVRKLFQAGASVNSANLSKQTEMLTKYESRRQDLSITVNSRNGMIILAFPVGLDGRISEYSFEFI